MTESLQALSRRENASVFMVLLAAYQTLLSRYTEQEDIIVGAPVAGRSTPAVEGLIGLFMRVLPLRTDLSGDPTFRELLGRVRQTTLDALEQQDVPFTRLLAAAQAAGHAKRSPLYQTLFVFENVPLPSTGNGELRWSVEDLDINAATVDVTLELAPVAGGIDGHW